MQRLIVIGLSIACLPSMYLSWNKLTQVPNTYTVFPRTFIARQDMGINLKGKGANSLFWPSVPEKLHENEKEIGLRGGGGDFLLFLWWHCFRVMIFSPLNDMS